MTLVVDKAILMLVLTIIDEFITGGVAFIQALRTDDAEVQAKKDAVIAKMMAEPDLTDPMAKEAQ